MAQSLQQLKKQTIMDLKSKGYKYTVDTLGRVIYFSEPNTYTREVQTSGFKQQEAYKNCPFITLEKGYVKDLISTYDAVAFSLISPMESALHGYIIGEDNGE